MAISKLKSKTANLLAAFYGGDNNAFSELYNIYVQILYNYGIKITNNEELLKDCIHDVFVKVHAKRDEQSKIDNFASYVIISLKNRLFDEFRHNSFTSDTDFDEYSLRRSTTDIEHDYICDETIQLTQERVADLMENLTRRQKQAITLYYLEERKYDEICSIMNMNYHSVRNLMHRGMLKLREAAQ